MCPNTEFFYGPYFAAFGLNTERYEVSLHIQSECGKIRTRKNSVFGQFHTVFVALTYLLQCIGVHCSPNTLGPGLVRYLEADNRDHEGWHLELFVAIPWSSFIQQMRKTGTFGDELALRAVANLFNVETTLVSTLGEDAMAIM